MSVKSLLYTSVNNIDKVARNIGSWNSQNGSTKKFRKNCEVLDFSEEAVDLSESPIDCSERLKK